MVIRKLEGKENGSQAELTRLLMAASAAYYGNGHSKMPDLEFDRLVEELARMEQKSGYAYEGSPTMAVGSLLVDSLKKVKHTKPALSLDKVKYKDRQELVNWLGDKQGVLSWKADGLTIVVTYDNGKFQSAVTRGDGYEGSDITHNAIYFDGLPSNIPYKGRLVVRGEAVMEYAEFERVNAESGGIYENPRNLATATVQMLDPRESSKRKICFQAFKLVEPEPDNRDKIMRSEDGRFAFLERQGIAVIRHSLVIGCTILNEIEKYKSIVQKNPYPTDGLVLSYANQVYAESLGSTGHHPRGSIAMKWTDETTSTTIRSIYWSVGKTGQITPVAVFDPVRLGAGSTVTRASLHNLSIMEHMPLTDEPEKRIPIGIGSPSEVYLANMIIPQIASVKPGLAKIEIPKKCPVCGNETRQSLNNGAKTLYCVNAHCPARTRGMLVNAFSKNGLNVKGLGPSQIEDLQQAGLVKTHPIEFFRLEREFGRKLPPQLEFVDGWGEKSWNNLLDALNAARKTTLKRLLYSLGIPMLGNDLSKKLSDYWHGDTNRFLAFVERPDETKLRALDGVGETKARLFVDWCRHVHNDVQEGTRLQWLVRDELEIEAPAAVPADAGSLQGMTFVITGAVHDYKNRDEFKASVEARGGKVTGSVSKNTAYLINNDLESASSKNKKAKELGIPIISEDDFIRMFGR